MKYSHPRITAAAVVFLSVLCAFESLSFQDARSYVASVVKDAMRQAGTLVPPDKMFDNNFDMPAFARRCLIDHWDELSQLQRDIYIEKFSKLLKSRLENANSDFSKRYKILSRKIGRASGTEEGGIAVPASFRVNDRGTINDVKFVYFVVGKGPNYKLADFELDGALLSRNYRGHFNNVIRDHGFDGLIERIDKKAVETGNSASPINSPQN